MSSQFDSGGQTADRTDSSIATENESGRLYVRDHPSTEYTVITSRIGSEDTSVHGHQLLACLENDPHEVFAEGTVVHHEAMTVVPVDVPSNLRVMDAGDHARGHADGTLNPKPIGEVLDEG